MTTPTYGTLDRRMARALLVEFLNANPPARRVAIDVRDTGAVADVVADQRAAIQRALDDAGAAGGGTVHVPDGTWYLDPTGNPRSQTYGGLRVPSRVHLALSPRAVLRALPVATSVSAVVQVCDGATDVRISGGTICGEREGHAGTTGEWGHGLVIWNAASRVLVDGVTVRDCWGDGVILMPLDHANAADRPSHVTLRNVRSTNNRRNNLSICGATDVRDEGGLYTHANGTAPQAGIDLEPDTAACPNERITFAGTRSWDNAGDAFVLAGVTGLDNRGVRGTACTFMAYGDGTYPSPATPRYALFGLRNADALFVGCTFNGPVIHAKDCRFVACDFTLTQTGGTGLYAFQAGGAWRVELERCTITAAGGAYPLYVDGSLTEATRKLFRDVDIVHDGNTPADLAYLIAIVNRVTFEGGSVRQTGAAPATRYNVSTALAGGVRFRNTYIEYAVGGSLVNADGVVHYDPAAGLVAQGGAQPGSVSGDRGNASAVLTVFSDHETQRWATTLTGARSVTLGVEHAFNGARFRIVRPAGGAFPLDVGGLRALAAGEWCEVRYDGAAWRLVAAGTL